MKTQDKKTFAPENVVENVDWVDSTLWRIDNYKGFPVNHNLIAELDEINFYNPLRYSRYSGEKIIFCRGKMDKFGFE